MSSITVAGPDETGLRPDGSTVNPELTCQRVHADALRAGCSHSVHFLVRQACSRSFLWLRRRVDQRIIGPVLGLRIIADALTPRGNKPLDPWSPVPAALHCVHHFRRTRLSSGSSLLSSRQGNQRDRASLLLFSPCRISRTSCQEFSIRPATISVAMPRASSLPKSARPHNRTGTHSRLRRRRETPLRRR